ncbi:MAG TPA: hypothetical protein VN442_17150 [Bryobacteraceae bacterium]|nr:hypothetical protein [Bryobacteraceae bacterium]
MRVVYSLPALFATASVLFGAAVQPTAEAFAARALPALPLEPSYAFQKTLAERLEPLRRDPNARPASSELGISGQGWRLLIRRDSGPLLRHAAEQFRDRLADGMRTRLAIETVDSLEGGQRADRVVVAGTREQMPGCGANLAGPKDYRIMVSGESIAVCGYDERGAMYGLYNLEARFSLREAPFVPRNLDTTRRSLFSARMTLSGLGWMNWPDNYLATAARYGFDAIHDSIYRNPNNAPGVGPHWDKMKAHPPGAMQDLVRRAAKQGLGVYVPILWRYTPTPENEAGLRKLVRDIVTEFPDIRGYVLLTEGFYYERWFGAGGQNQNEDLRKWLREWARGVAIVTEECHRINPAIEVLPWEYNVDFRPGQAENKAYGTAQLPRKAIPLLTFENGKAFELDGEQGSLKDYAINVVGPAEVTQAQIREAKRLGSRVYCKADTWASWQYGTFPYLPLPYQWHQRYEALEKWGVDGTLESWSYGFKPNFVAEMRAWYSWSGAPPLDDLLRSMARRDFGAGSEGDVLEAWKRFSQAIRLVPDTGPNWGTNNAVATPLFLKQPKPRMETRYQSWSDSALWARTTGVNPHWPYVPARLILWPDFTNKVNAAERYARPFSLPVFMKYLRLAADEMEAGLRPYRRAALAAPAAKRTGAYREVLLAEQLQRMMRSEYAVLEFEDLRFRLGTAGAAERPAMLGRLEVILREETARTQASLAVAERDSRLGYEWEQDYVYTPDTLREKLAVLKHTLTVDLPPLLRGLGR